MKRVLKWIAVVIAAVLVISVAFCLPEAATAAKSAGLSEAKKPHRYTALATEAWVSDNANEILCEIPLNSLIFNKADGTALSDSGTAVIAVGDTVSFTVGQAYDKANVMLEYKPTEQKTGECKITLVNNDKDYVGFIPILWGDETDDYSADRNGSEYTPKQVMLDTFVKNCIRDFREADKQSIVIESGDISLSPSSQGIEISAVYLVKPKNASKYSEYQKANKNKDKGKDFVVIEAEKYSVKSDSFIRGGSESNPALSPYSPYKKLINNLTQGSWNTAGQKVIWEFEIENAGLYKLGFRYRQDANVNKQVFRSIEIDGSYPFKEAALTAFPYSGSSSYKNLVFSSDEGEYYIYLEKGSHTLAMTAETGDYARYYEEIRALMSDIGDVGMRLKKLTAGSDDDNRTWDMDSYMPDAVELLNSFADRIDKVYEGLEDLSGATPTYASNLLYASETLRKLTEEPSHIPNRTEQINSGDSSANKYLGTVLESLTASGLGLDRIYIFGDNKKLPSADENFFVRAVDTVKSFIFSFLVENTSDYAVDKGKNGELTVWVNRSIQYVQVLQRIVDAKYNSVNGTNIELSVMPSEQKLILSNATKTNPDVVLGVTASTPFNLAIRGAVKNLLEYEDFLEFYNGQYNLEALVPMVYGDGVYGACETFDFQVLFYRKDILNSLGLSVPDTWNDVKKMMPTLLRNSMNFFIPLSGSGGYKNYNMTTPFLYQNGGAVYSDDGVSTAIDTQLAQNGFWDMTELYNIYSLDTVVASFYNSFRQGDIPIGVSGFSNYIQLLIAAPELAGQWDIAVTPGTVSDSGEILRSQMADVNACMIFENTDKPDEAWKFLKWWLSEETQTEYALNLQTTYGSEYRWNTSNLKTFKQLPYDEAHKSVILEQWQSQMENIRHPANYMVEREISNIWNNTVINSEGLIETLDESVVLINREIERKLKEFGYIDDNGVVVKDYATNAYEFLVSELKR